MNHEQIEALLGVLRESPTLTEVEVRYNGTALRVRRPASATKATKPTVKPAVASTAREESTSTALVPATYPLPVTVNAELVGVFRPHRPPIQVGDTVKAKQPLGQIEAMRLMNDCTAPATGQVLAVLVSDGQPVEYGQPLFEIAPEEA
jgi:acetyl-CoA carboxylase biotin carboxyl carrier protein